jgi:hypothetical protein
MAVEQILAEITDAAASDAFVIGPQEATITMTALGGGETGDIQIGHQQTPGDDVDWQDLFRSGTQQTLDETNNSVTVLGPGKFRVNKSATAAATSVNLWT